MGKGKEKEREKESTGSSSNNNNSSCSKGGSKSNKSFGVKGTSSSSSTLETTGRENKVARKKQEAEIERQRRNEVDVMVRGNMCASSEGEYSDDEAGETDPCHQQPYDITAQLMAGVDNASQERLQRRQQREEARMTTDRFGNTVLRADKEEGEKMAILRREARERREAKAKAVTTAVDGDGDGDGTDVSVADLSNSLKEGGKISNSNSNSKGKIKSDKLTRKEKRRLEQGLGLGAGDINGGGEDQRVGDSAMLLSVRQRELELELDSFNLSVQAGGNHSADEEGEEGSAAARDIIVPCFSISAPNRPLFVDASLKLSAGRRYGLLGPNGRGKTTLLKFLAARRLPMPAAVDVLLVQQEAEASSVSIVEQVLRADKRRGALLKEEEELLALLERQGLQEKSPLPPVEPDEQSSSSEAEVVAAWTEGEWQRHLDRFAALGEELAASGADACEARVRSILTGLGFTEQQMEQGTLTLSGGWRMRVSLACALFMQPKLLLLDEPTNHL